VCGLCDEDGYDTLLTIMSTLYSEERKLVKIERREEQVELEGSERMDALSGPRYSHLIREAGEIS
jgi:hypothetical protein